MSRNTRYLSAWRGLAFILLVVLSLAAQANTQGGLDATAEVAASAHVGSVEEALVAIEVANRAKEEARETIRRGNGFVLRCDGFVIAPAALFGSSGQGREEQSVTVILHPGTNHEKRLKGRRPRYFARGIGYAVLKLDDIHTPALRTLLPNALQAGDTVLVVASPWNAVTGHFTPLTKRTVQLGTPRKEDDHREPGWIPFQEPLTHIPAGATVVGPDGMAVGLVPGSGNIARCEGFLSFSMLNQATNCVTPLPTPDSVEAARRAGSAASGGVLDDMVPVPGGKLVLPAAVLLEQRDMERARTACVAPFMIDRFEVTNAQYYAFWLSLPEAERRRLGFQVRYYPLTWAKTDPPFPPELANLPVLGVPLTGAIAYATWKGKRLPTPYEWCLAAFGPDGEADMPEWARHYIAERRAAWFRVRDLHSEYLVLHPEARNDVNFVGPATHLPWIVRPSALLYISQWSKAVIEQAYAPLWQIYNDPLYVLPVGSRDFDESPYGAKDMILNAYELVMPSPAVPARGRPRYMKMEWIPLQPAREDPWAPRMIEIIADKHGLQPLSRLVRRTLLSPPAEELLVHSHLHEVVTMLAPLAGWRLRMEQDYESTATGGTSGLFTRRPYGQLLAPAGYSLWQEVPAHFRQEMGRPIPLADADRQGIDGPQLVYYLPIGFRCVR